MLSKLKQILTSQEKRELLILTLGLALLSLSEVFGIGILLPLVGMFLNPGIVHTSKVMGALYRISGASDTISFLVMLAVVAVVIFILKSIYSVFILYWQQSFVSKIHARLTRTVLNHYLHRPYSFHLMNNSSVLFRNIIAEVGQFTTSLLSPMVSVYSEGLILAGIFIFLACLYPVVTLLIAVSIGMFLAGFNIIFKRRLRVYAEERARYSEEMYKAALESLNAVKEISVYNMQEFFKGKFGRAVQKYNEGFIKSMVVNGLPRNLLEVALFSSLVVSIIVSVYARRDYAELIPMIMVIGVAAMKIMPSVSKISANINTMHYSFNSLNMVSDIMRECGDSEGGFEPAKRLRVTPDGDPLLLKNVNFRYESADKAIFENLNIAIPLHKITGIVGETGSGKSTLIDIFMGLLVPSNGALYYHGVLIDRANVDGYRQNVGYVPQNIFLLDDTIAANIAFGIPREKIDFRKLEEVVTMAHLDSFIKELPRGFDSLVGERGVRISGGQRQRIGIARALYRDPDILVLDEATSALDAKTEAEVYVALKNIKLKLTIILVTHRLSTLEKSDLIYVLDRGTVVDKGGFKDLSGRSSVFQRMLQQKAAV